MRTNTFVKWSGLALRLWALHLLIRDPVFAFTHGSSQAAMDLTFLGLRAGHYAVLWTPFALLGVAGLAGVYAEVSPLIGKRGRAGLGVAIVGLALLFVAGVMQYWIPGTSFNSPLSLSGLYLSLLALLVATFGLIVAGLDIRRTDPLPRGRSVVLIIGLVAVPTILFRSWVVMNSPDTFSWRLLYVGAFVPWELCWAWLGYVLVAASRNPGHALPSRPQ